MFLRECKYIEKKVVRQIHDNLGDFSCDDYESKNKLELVRIVFQKL